MAYFFYKQGLWKQSFGGSDGQSYGRWKVLKKGDTFSQTDQKWSEVKWNHSVVSNSFDPVDCRAPGFSVYGTSQARILEWVAISFSRNKSEPNINTAKKFLSTLNNLASWSWKTIYTANFPIILSSFFNISISHCVGQICYCAKNPILKWKKEPQDRTRRLKKNHEKPTVDDKLHFLCVKSLFL